jgi:large subunit ribosomal protein L10e
MAKIRPGKTYRDMDKPAYTRKSKYRRKSFVKGIPGSKIVMFDMGNKKGSFEYRLVISAKSDVVIRHNALEAARIVANKFMNVKAGKENYHIKIKTFPHHILRENPIAGGAGADRYSSGMRQSFGKPIGYAARVNKGQEIMYVRCNQSHVKFAKEALRKVSHKLPGKCSVEIAKSAESK